MELFKIQSLTPSLDGKHLILVFETDGEPLTVGVNASALNDIMVFVGGALEEARRVIGATKLVSANPVKTYLADATQDRRAVLIELTTNLSFAHRFVFDPRDATVFEAQIHRAVRDCGPSATPPKAAPKK